MERRHRGLSPDEVMADLEEAGIDLDPVPDGQHRHGDEVHASDHSHPHHHSGPDELPSVGIVGAGPVGTALGVALTRAGWPVDAVASRDPARRARFRELVGLGAKPFAEAGAVVDEVELIVLAVPDDALAGLASELRLYSGQAMVHTSGALGAEVLEPAMAAGTQVGTFSSARLVRGCRAVGRGTPGRDDRDRGRRRPGGSPRADGRGRRCDGGPACAGHQAGVPRRRGPRGRRVHRPARCDRRARPRRRARRGRLAGRLRSSDGADPGECPGPRDPGRAHRTDDPRRRRDGAGPSRRPSRATRPTSCRSTVRPPSARSTLALGRGAIAPETAIALGRRPCRRALTRYHVGHAAQHRREVRGPTRRALPPTCGPVPDAPARPARHSGRSSPPRRDRPSCGGPTSARSSTSGPTGARSRRPARPDPGAGVRGRPCR